ncbi:triacylglycerol lipase [Massilia sp. H6]|uniref:esterase/lipase family protein n=1 Tax=Massilia sp. H6 TaxID=2970464 RepID=UPI002167FDDF|nr:hypothetical protein [Massilia sp. H6]UVW27626.1 hypothetical protein NRS07_13855 [Massilia sp. H6]
MKEASVSNQLNERGNHQGEFSQGVGGWAEYTVYTTALTDGIRHDVTVPPKKVIPVIFLPGVMGSNLRLSKERQKKLERPDNRSWRPDDMVGLANQIGLAAFDVGLGGWYKNASPEQRQLMLDPNETEVEYYHYTESKDRFDPEGKETLEADKRHQNVPNHLVRIPPLLGQRAPAGWRPPRAGVIMKKRETPAQVARWRGWSEVMFDGAYGKLLKTAENHLNNMVARDQPHPTWKPFLADPSRFGGVDAGPALTEQDLKQVAACWYPVHAMGYNYLRSNGESAKVIAERIRGLARGYQKRGFQCDEVIVITHSMGGLLARALIHPKYGNLLDDPTVKVLGIYHNVMPSTGAAASYKRMRFGFLEGSGTFAEIKASIFGIDGKHATAILANAPAALELLPGSAYGKSWLKVVDGSGREMWSWPGSAGSALDEIYLQQPDKWWRLLHPEWVNPGRIEKRNGGGLANVSSRLTDAARFIQDIQQSFHPTSCYASFCSSSERLSYGEIVFKVTNPEVWDARHIQLPPVEEWKLLSDDAKGTLKVQTGTRVLTLVLQPPATPGDETVPAARSAKQITGKLFVHGETEGKSYEHQNSYADQDVLASLLYSVIQIAKTAKWERP